MSNSIDSSTRSPFFPNSRKTNSSSTQGAGAGSAIDRAEGLKRADRAQEISARTGQDARVEIPDAVRDYSRIKKAVDAAPPMDNSEKIARLKQQINAGTYQVDYDGLAEKILQNEY